MKKVNLKILPIILFFLLLLNTYSCYANIQVIASMNVYGNVAKQLGGSLVNVINILNNPTQDPHLFNVNPTTVKAVRNAQIIIINGANYDPWMATLIKNSSKSDQHLIVVADLIQSKNKFNPHIWYIPQTMVLFAQYLVKKLILIDPQHKKYYEKNLQQFTHEYQAIYQLIAELRKTYNGTQVIATESLFNYMAESIGLIVRGEKFQLSMMNDLPPPVSAIKSFEDDLRQHKVVLLFYNKQVSNLLTKRMLAIASTQNIPSLGMYEMMPNHIGYIDWIIGQLKMVERALKKRENHA